MSVRLSAVIAFFAVLTLSACNQSKSTAPDIVPPAQNAANTNQPEALPDQALQVQDEDLNQQKEQTTAEQQAAAEPGPQPQPSTHEADNDDKLFAIQSAEELKKLLAEGANVNHRDEDGRTVLWDIDLDFVDHITDNDYTKAIEIAKILIDAGLDLTAKDKDGKTAMFNMRLDEASEQYIKLLLDHGADARVVAKDGTTVLFSAVEVCAPNIIKVLINAGADVNAKNKDGKTYLDAADEDCRNKLISELNTSPKAAMTEKEIQNSLRNLVPGRTVLSIAHRLSTLRDADRLIVIEKGEIAEEGTHDELLEIEDGIFKRLNDLQNKSLSSEGLFESAV